MTNIVVLIKQVPDTWSERKLSDGDFTLDRDAADAVLDEINERAVEEALLIKEREGDAAGTVTVLTAGPERATEAIRKGAVDGADKAVHLLDPGLQTARTWCRPAGPWPARSVRSRASTWSSPVTRPPTAPAVRFRRSSPSTWACPSRPTCARSIGGGKVVGERETDDGVFTVEASLPAVISVNEKDQRAALPVLQGIMAAKKKEVAT